mgnify:FL=1
MQKGENKNEEKCKKIRGITSGRSNGCQHSGLHATSKPQESTGEQNAQASDATQGTEEPAAPEGLEVDTQTPITLRLTGGAEIPEIRLRWQQSINSRRNTQILR